MPSSTRLFRCTPAAFQHGKKASGISCISISCSAGAPIRFMLAVLLLARIENPGSASLSVGRRRGAA
jgi:hypothetical protein